MQQNAMCTQYTWHKYIEHVNQQQQAWKKRDRQVYELNKERNSWEGETVNVSIQEPSSDWRRQSRQQSAVRT